MAPAVDSALPSYSASTSTPLPDPLDQGARNEDTENGPRAGGDLEIRFERIPLAAVAVAAHGDVDHTQGLGRAAVDHLDARTIKPAHTASAGMPSRSASRNGCAGRTNRATCRRWSTRRRENDASTPAGARALDERDVSAECAERPRLLANALAARALRLSSRTVTSARGLRQKEGAVPSHRSS